ncbi:MAG: hypothetical protein ACKN9V_10780, partial [Pseudomonadota bacterium]
QDLLVLASGRTIQAEAPKAVDQQIISQLMNDKNPEIPKNKTEIRETLNYAKTDANYATVTLEVTPDQAQTIAFVMSTYGGTLTLLMRNADDRTISSKRNQTLEDVMGPDSFFVRGPKQKEAAPAPKVKFNDFQGGNLVPVTE